ncbi:MAG: hypothetical protein JNM69_37750 [Archangium sp.]|nr:hypothetical protein [Archangium sp.]
MPARLVDASRELQDPKTPFARVQKLLRQVPDDVPAEVVAEAALKLRDPHSWWGFARNVEQLPERVIRVIVERLRDEPNSRLSIYLLAALHDSADLQRDWARAIRGLLDLNTTYGWGSKQRKAKIAGLASGPLLPAIQAAAARGEGPTLDMLAVLAADGSEASVDALMPHFHAAASSQSQTLDHLERLKTHAAKTEPIRLMFESVEQLLGQRNDESPALAFARSIGFDVDTFSVHWSLSSTALNASHVPVFQGHVDLDSTSAVWFRVSISHVPGVLAEHRTTAFGSEKARVIDELGLGRCDPGELPAWLIRAAKKLKVQWSVRIWNSSLRGAKRERALAWMRGEEPSAQVKEPKAATRRTRAGSR